MEMIEGSRLPPVVCSFALWIRRSALGEIFYIAKRRRK